ncbi:RNA polymerase Rpb2, domain 6 [Ordospora pajunii]|uniref:RNA polymerase Rpb2, domain 6 n=1 Tax=Ordospora pajunii TaxID=3039483 RepID=UPI0029528AFB|nr:RNA polymerase Rpb2, domain 6 [Ordospora pajunii]KAH9410559.1 RNA polymerase Rpb2, domain 6 [Ordospora pajunii]
MPAFAVRCASVYVNFYTVFPMREDQRLELIKLFFREKGLVRQHIESYDYFVNHEIKALVKANQVVDSDIDHTFYLKYLDIRVGKSSIEESMVKYNVFPIECRLRDITYSADIYVDVEYVRNGQIVVKRDVCIGKMPVMLRSSKCHLSTEHTGVIESRDTKAKKIRESQECPLDVGGYFVIRGIERVILIQEQLSKNRIIIESGAKGLFASVTSSTDEHKSKTSVTVKDDCYYLKSSMFNEEVPVVIVIKALGLVQDREIAECVGREYFDMMVPSFGECMAKGVFTNEQALHYIGNCIKLKQDDCKVDEVRTILSEKILPNVHIDGCDMRKKGIYISFMIRRLTQTRLGILKEDDKDFVGNKRFELAGQLLSILFEDTFKRFNFELKKSIDKILSKRTRAQEFDALTFLSLQANMITSTLSRAISTGNWNLKRFRMERSGVTHVLLRHSYISALGMMTKINSHFEKTRKVSGPRSLHTSSWGMLCPVDTPEGESCGLVKNLALLAEITTDSDVKPIMDLIFRLGVVQIEAVYTREIHANDVYSVFINGDIVGITNRVDFVVNRFKLYRRKGLIGRFVSIYKVASEKIVHIASDNGRICRPLIVVDKERKNMGIIEDSIENAFQRIGVADGMIDAVPEDAKRKNSGFFDYYLKHKSFSDLLEEGFIEYLDANEENDCLVALKPEDVGDETTHLEISEFAILGYVAGLVPFPHHNQSPRNTYQCAMGKQAIGHIALNTKKRFDSVILQLTYTHKPMVSTKILDLINYNEMPAGQNAMVAVMSYSGYDIEDALILNKASIDRGIFRVEVYKTNTAFLKKHGNGMPDMLNPNPNESVLDIDGLGKPGKMVKDGSVYVNKTSPVDGIYKFTGKIHRGEPAYIDKVLIAKSQDQTLIKTMMRQTRPPEIGDKLSSRHGQKGVIGLIVKQEDMPFNDQGIVPDIIMNPHGFPSRMTVGKIIELISGKAGVLEGKIADSTAFKKNLVEETCQLLVRNGYSYSGKDCFTSGTTGAPLMAYIFFGPVFYQRLKHMVADKIHMRARGPRAILTRQPTEGRSKDGGLRLGEMERDCLIGYGASSLIVERLMVSSDAFETYVCKSCGVLAFKGCCVACKSTTPSIVTIPYACKLLFQELMSMNILPRLHIE